MTLLSACQRSSEPNDAASADTAPAATQPLPIKADLEIASGDEKAMLSACTRVVSLVVFLWNGREDWPGTNASSQPWFNTKFLDEHAEEVGRLMKWLANSNSAELDRYYGKPVNDDVVAMMRENGWPDANPAVPFQLSEAQWQVLARRLLLCGSLSKGRVADTTATTASPANTPPAQAPAKPRVQTPAGHPPIILEAQPE